MSREMTPRTKTRDEIEKELYELEDKMSKLLDYITNSRISKPDTDLNTIKSVFDEEIEKIISREVKEDD